MHELLLDEKTRKQVPQRSISLLASSLAAERVAIDQRTNQIPQIVTCETGRRYLDRDRLLKKKVNSRSVPFGTQTKYLYHPRAVRTIRLVRD
jgi:hypothetical protein